MMNEDERMLAGKLSNPRDPELRSRQRLAHRLAKRYNDTFDDEAEKRAELLKKLLPNSSERIYLQGPIFVDYGTHIKIGDHFYGNTNITFLDTGMITIGENVLFGPNISLVTPMHPLRYQDRNFAAKNDLPGKEYSKPITIEDNCWLASNVTVIGGVTIGNGSVIGAGSVVTRDIPANFLAVGNPCRVLRQITDQDDIRLKKDLF